MTPKNQILNALRERGIEPRLSGNDWMCRCPAHDDRSPSLSIRELSDGCVLIKCWAGCGAQSIVEAVGLVLADLFPAKIDPSYRASAPPRFNPREVMKTALTEATILALGYRALQRGDTLPVKDQGRVEVAIQTLGNLRAEVAL